MGFIVISRDRQELKISF